jgi:hypothetical protein
MRRERQWNAAASSHYILLLILLIVKIAWRVYVETPVGQAVHDKFDDFQRFYSLGTHSDGAPSDFVFKVGLPPAFSVPSRPPFANRAGSC